MNDDDVVYYRVPNWDRYQHYKNKGDGWVPQWIKFYINIAADFDFSKLPDWAKVQVFSVWVLAARTGNQIPTDPSWLEKHNMSSKKFDMPLLVSRRFLEIAYTSCLDDAYTRSMPNRKEEKRKEPVPVPDGGVETIGVILKRLGDVA